MNKGLIAMLGVTAMALGACGGGESDANAVGAVDNVAEATELPADDLGVDNGLVAGDVNAADASVDLNAAAPVDANVSVGNSVGVNSQ